MNDDIAPSGEILSRLIGVVTFSDPTQLFEEAISEIQRLQAQSARWRKIADDFAEAGTHPTAHDMVIEDYEQEARRD